MLGAARLQPMHAAADPLDLQGVSAEAFVQRLGGAVEHAPWVAARAWAARPFADLDALAAAMRSAILRASREEQLALLRGHPELAGREASAGTLTDESTGEQARLGLLALDAQQHALLRELNGAYRQRFGFPLIIALRLHPTLTSVFAEAQRRLRQPPEAEWDAALQQVCEVMRGRLERLFAPPPLPPADRKDMP
jgi:2-oxo-4-hydroxy-4-carboxy-5-ureidoimidazoline decarboxylase